MSKASGADEMYEFSYKAIKDVVTNETLRSITEYIEQILDSDIEILDDLILDGSVYRFGRKNNEWYVGNDEIITLGSWRTGEKKTFRLSDRKLNRKEVEESKRRGEERKKKLEIENLKKKEETRKSAISLLGDADNQLSLYLKRKSLTSNHGAKTRKDGRFLLIPIVDASGLHSLQIVDDDNSSNKRFLSGTQKKGSFFLLDSNLDDYLDRIKESRECYLCEGFATGASIKEAISEVEVVISFDAYNLIEVCKTLISINSKIKIIICADRDLSSATGESEALKVINEISMTEYILPEFIEEDNKLSDFNDVHAYYGLDAVKNQIECNKRIKSWRNNDE